MNLSVSGEELLYLSAITGVDNIWGIKDPFAEQTEQEIVTAMLNLRNSLVRKGYLISNIDTQFAVEDDCMRLLRHCMESERVYVLDSSQTEEDSLILRYFVHDGIVVQYRFNGNASLAFSTDALMRAEISAFFGDSEEEENEVSLVTGVARIRRMGSLSRQRFLQELRNIGCEEELALLIADGLQGNADFCSLFSYDRNGDQDVLVDKLVTLRFAGGSLMVTPAVNRIDMVCFTRLSHNRLTEQLDMILGQMNEIEAV